MRRFRFRIGSVLILIVLLGVGFAASREANDLWDSIVLSAAAGVLLVSVLLELHRRAERRAFWVGFALIGWGYAGLAAIPSIETRLLTSKALVYLDSQVPGRPADTGISAVWGGAAPGPNQRGTTLRLSAQGNALSRSNNSGSVWILSSTTGKFLWARGPTTENFVRIGHSLLALILAWLGGALSRHLHIWGRERHPALDPA